MTTVETRGSTFDVVDGSAAAGFGGYYADDLLAVQAESDTRAKMRLPSHFRHHLSGTWRRKIRLQSSDGQTGWGDAVTVWGTGVRSGREPIDLPWRHTLRQA